MTADLSTLRTSLTGLLGDKLAGMEERLGELTVVVKVAGMLDTLTRLVRCLLQLGKLLGGHLHLMASIQFRFLQPGLLAQMRNQEAGAATDDQRNGDTGQQQGFIHHDGSVSLTGLRFPRRAAEQVEKIIGGLPGRIFQRLAL